jgi:hypothetical protein
MSFFDFVVDLMWGASEIFIARKEDKKRKEPGSHEDAVAGANRQDGEAMSDEMREMPDRELADRERAARIVGNKTV